MRNQPIRKRRHRRILRCLQLFDDEVLYRKIAHYKMHLHIWLVNEKDLFHQIKTHTHALSGLKKIRQKV